MRTEGGTQKILSRGWESVLASRAIRSEGSVSDPRTVSPSRPIRIPIWGQYFLCSSRPLGRDRTKWSMGRGLWPSPMRLGFPPPVLIAEAHIECIYLAGSEVQIDTRGWVFQEWFMASPHEDHRKLVSASNVRTNLVCLGAGGSLGFFIWGECSVP